MEERPMISPATVSIGAAIWREIAPGRRIKIARNKRRARKGKPLLPLSDEDFQMLPNNTMTPTGGFIAVASPIAAQILVTMGVGECTPETLEAGCVGATQIVGIVGSIIGGVLILVGKLRSMRREKALKAELEAAKAGA